MVGINLSGAEFGKTDRYGYDYVYPGYKELAYYGGLGVDLVRLPFKWERMQPNLNGALDPAELGRMKTFLDNAAEAGIEVVVDLHNYGRYKGEVIGSGSVTSAAFADFWTKLSGALKDQPALKGYDIMNEPHDMGGAMRWPTAAQAAVDAIRKVDMKNVIYVEGEGWAGAHTWPTSNPYLNIKDPANNFYYEAHQYFDKNNSGTYGRGGYDQEGAYANIGVDRLKPFTEWLEARGAKGFIGEFAVPDNDPRWLTVLDNFLNAMKANGLDGTYWGAGSWWGNYPMALVGGDGKPNPQLDVLLKHVDDVVTTPIKPTPKPLPPTDDDPVGHTVNGTGGADKLVGTNVADVMKGFDGKDSLDGRGGADSMAGGAESDTYYVDNSGDRVIELAGQGNDVVHSYISYSLGANVEHLTLRGGATINGTGNALDNRIEGNDAVNNLWGNAGNDILVGRSGADVLHGGSGRDVFDFNATSDSRGDKVDRILDFVKGQDKIDLSTIDANAGVGGNQAFRFIGAAAFTGAAGEVRVVTSAGQTKVYANVNGDHIADFAVTLTNYDSGLQSSDFLL